MARSTISIFTMLAALAESLPLPSQSLWYLLIPILATLIASVVAIWTVPKLRATIDRWISSGPNNRFRFETGIAALDLCGIVAFAHAAGFEAISKGEVSPHGATMVAIMLVLIVVFFAAQSLVRSHEEHADGRIASLKEAHQGEMAEARGTIEIVKADREFGILINRLFLGRIDKIKARILETVTAAEARNRPLGVPGLISALAPNQMLRELVITTYHFFDQQMAHQHGAVERRSLRVALFQKNGERLEHVFSFNGDTSGCVRSPMDNEQPPASYVMSIDTNQKGFFRKDQIEKYRVLADNIGRRLHLANMMERLVKNVSLEARKKNESEKTA